jgi:dihydrolipoamide dehydrogenase
MADRFDIGIIGGGPGGYVAAIRAAQLGARVVLVEQERLGGVCLNRGCIPTKAMASSIELLMEIENAAEFGIVVGEPGFDFSRMMARKDQVVERLVSGVEKLMEAHKVLVVVGHGEVLSRQRITVSGPSPHQLEVEKIVIATGSLPSRPPVPGLDLSGVITSDEILALEEPPVELLIVGGGVIGVEFASIFNALGTKVTVIEMLPALLPPVDEELRRRYLQLLGRQGVEVHLNSPLKEIREGEGYLEALYEGPDGEGVVQADAVLISTGRIPTSEGLNLEEAGVLMKNGAIVVDEHMATNVPGI